MPESVTRNARRVDASSSTTSILPPSGGGGCVVNLSSFGPPKERKKILLLAVADHPHKACSASATPHAAKLSEAHSLGNESPFQPYQESELGFTTSVFQAAG
jgi:hypothetical protein